MPIGYALAVPPSRLDDDALAAALPHLPRWKRVDDRLYAEFIFADFNQAIGFMMRCALVCEQLNHHPNWSNVYRSVKVNLWTHDAGGITDLDLRLAQTMSRFASESGAQDATLV